MRKVLMYVIVSTLLTTLGVFVPPAEASDGTFGPYPISFTELAWGPDGALYATDIQNARIYRIDRTGDLSLFAGSGPGGFPVWVKDQGWVPATPYSGDGGPAIAAEMNATVGLAFDAAGNLFVADHGNDRIRRIDTSGIITTIAGTGQNDPFGKGQFVPGVGKQGGDGRPATQATLDAPWGISFDAAGNLYIADRDHDAVRRIARNGIITTVAGNGSRGFSGDGKLATESKLNRVSDVAVTPDGTMYLADESNARIRKVNPKGIISTIGGTGALGCGGDGGPATAAPIQNPQSIAVGPDGSVYFTEEECREVRRIDPSGMILPVAGTGQAGCSGFGIQGSATQLTDPHDVQFGPDGSLYIADGTCGIVRIDPQGRSHLFVANPT